MRRTLAMVTLMLLSGAQARAQQPADTGPPLHPTERSGFTVGLAIGGGEFHALFSQMDAMGNSSVHEQLLTDDFAHVSLRFGKAFHQNLLGLVMLEYGNGGNQSHTVIGAALQTYFGERVFARFGGGLDRFKAGSSDTSGMGMGSMEGCTSLSSCDGDFGAAAMFGLGVEFLQFRTMALDIELMFRSGFHSLGPSGASSLFVLLDGTIGVGIQWF